MLLKRMQQFAVQVCVASEDLLLSLESKLRIKIVEFEHSIIRFRANLQLFADRPRPYSYEPLLDSFLRTNDPEKLQIFTAEDDARLETIEGTYVPDRSKAESRWHHVALNRSQLVEESIDQQQQQPPPQQTMSYRREHRNSRTALFDDGLEEGGLRSSSSFSHETDDHDNDKAVHTLQDRVLFLKSLTGDIHEEVESQNRLLDRMGNNMDTSRGIMSGTMDRFKMVFEKKSSRRTCALAGFFILSFFILYYLIRVLVYLKQGKHGVEANVRTYRKCQGMLACSVFNPGVLQGNLQTKRWGFPLHYTKC
ncbi:GOLGI SNARE BET1-RELATED [Salix viminalis]|uniref:GOLGI SNARE BET1-RELATED n=1 Tax=Salix viminalis TaxID=40686 RepID=A0A9Q0U1M5_SALVM|nr:GOLGI SNARE BET1-RELATED [Salix viminalis]